MTILVSFALNMAYGKNYYLSVRDGDDRNTSIQAQNPFTPWKSLAKLNNFLSDLLPGDSVFFKKGEVFYGSVKFKASGTVSQPIVMSAYGNGAKPVISGFVRLSSWKSIGNGIYESSHPSAGPVYNMVVMNGVPKAMGRFPNTGYLSYESSTVNSITDKQLVSDPDWTGAEIVVRKNHWIIDHNTISSHKANVIHFKSESTYPGITGFGYFIQNDLQTLDSLGEWFFNFDTKSLQMYFGVERPSNFSIKTATIDTLVLLNKINNITIENLSFEGSNRTAIHLSGTQNIYIQNCNFEYSGYNSISGTSSKFASSGTTIENCSINYSNNDAIDLDFSFRNTSILNNHIKNTGTTPGMGGNGDGKYLAVFTQGANTLIEKNTIDSTGYSGIYFKGDSIVVKNNLVNHSCMIKDDGGGIYTYRDKDEPSNSKNKIIGNIVLNSQGASNGTSPEVTQAQGIYLDGYTTNVDVLNNTVASCKDYGLFLNGTQNINIKDNTVFNNNIQLQMYNWGPGVRNVAIGNNIFFSKANAQLALDLFTISSDIDKFCSSDQNIFNSPFGDDFQFHVQSSVDPYPGKTYNLLTWSAAYKQDSNSKETFKKISEYSLKSLIGESKIPADYKVNVNQTAAAPIDHLISLEINEKNKKVIKVSMANNAVGNEVLLSMLNIGSVIANKNYILKFKATSEKTRIIKAYLCQTRSPYAILSQVQYQIILSSSSDAEVLLSAQKTEADARIVFEFDSENGFFWLEDAELHEADVVLTKVDDYIGFHYNETSSEKSFTLDGTYVDSYRKVFSNKITLKPFTSAVLIRLSTSISKISITSNTKVVCPKMPIIFTSTTINGGASPMYQWKVNGINIILTSLNKFTPTNLKNNDIVTCELINAAFFPDAVAFSNEIMVTGSIVEPTITITSNLHTACPGQLISFEASVVDSGQNTQFFWKINGVLAVDNPNTNKYASTTLKNNDELSCTLIVDAQPCRPAFYAISNKIIMNISQKLIPIINITKNLERIYTGSLVTFSAKVQNDGFNASYDWQVNGVSSGTNNLIYSNSKLKDGDVVGCVLVVTNECSTIQSVESNLISIHILKDIIPPNSFSPNGDGINDQWNILGINDYPECRVSIFTRNGKEVFRSIGYKVPWNGLYKGFVCDVGVYYYLIEAVERKKSGFLLLLK